MNTRRSAYPVALVQSSLISSHLDFDGVRSDQGIQAHRLREHHGIEVLPSKTNASPKKPGDEEREKASTYTHVHTCGEYIGDRGGQQKEDGKHACGGGGERRDPKPRTTADRIVEKRLSRASGVHFVIRTWLQTSRYCFHVSERQDGRTGWPRNLAGLARLLREPGQEKAPPQTAQRDKNN